MVYIKLFEEYKSDLTLLDIVKVQALRYNNKAILDRCIERGFDLQKHRDDLILYCTDNYYFDALKLIDEDYFNQIVEQTIRLGLSSKNIKELNQISCLKNLEALSVVDNKLTGTLDLSGLESLRVLECGHNKIEKIILPKNNLMYMVNCTNNELTSLDLSGQKNLQELLCNENKLEELDLKYNRKLEHILCTKNNLTHLNLKPVKDLQTLSCGDNQLTELDLKHTPLLESLICRRNQLTDIDISGLNYLKTFTCKGNNLNATINNIIGDTDMLSKEQIQEIKDYYKSVNLS